MLHLLLSHLFESPEQDVGVNSEALDTFVRTMRQDFPRERVPVVLAPLLYREQQDITEDRWAGQYTAVPFVVHVQMYINTVEREIFMGRNCRGLKHCIHVKIFQ